MGYVMGVIERVKKVVKSERGREGLLKYVWEKGMIEMEDVERMKGMRLEERLVMIEEGEECDMEEVKKVVRGGWEWS